MSENKKNDIIEDQRRARQEFINLKKMQQGEMYAGPKPSETATVLVTPKDKFKHFWLYNKWYVLGFSALIILIVFLVAQCASKIDYDMKVVYFVNTVAMDEQTEAIADYLKPYCEDVKGDGEVNIQVVNCSVSDDAGNASYRNTAYQKLQAIIVAEENAMLFVTDSAANEYFEKLGSDVEFFDSNSVTLGEDFYKKTKHEMFGNLPEGLMLSCRNVGGTVLESQDGSAIYYKAAQNILNNIKGEK